MTVTSENWIILLREDILDRGSLYPDSDPIPGINANNWLGILRDDIIARGTLYPDGEGDVGNIEPNNWLVKLRDDILDRGSLYPNVDAPEPVLSSLSVQGLSIQPSFDPQIFEYTGGTTITRETTMDITYDSQFSAVCYFNNTRYTPGNLVMLTEGINTFRAEVSNINNVKNIYVVSIAYTPPSRLMSNFTIENISLSPSFSPEVDSYTCIAMISAPSYKMTISLESPTATCTATQGFTSDEKDIPLSGVGPYTGEVVLEEHLTTLRIKVSNGSAPVNEYVFGIVKAG